MIAFHILNACNREQTKWIAIVFGFACGHFFAEMKINGMQTIDMIKERSIWNMEKWTTVLFNGKYSDAENEWIPISFFFVNSFKREMQKDFFYYLLEILHLFVVIVPKLNCWYNYKLWRIFYNTGDASIDPIIVFNPANIIGHPVL